MCTFRKILVLSVMLILLLVSNLNTFAQNPAPQGLDYPFIDDGQWKIASGYNNGDRHGGSSTEIDQNFYAYYAFDFVQEDGTAAGEDVLTPADVYYFRVQNSSEKCVDMAIGTFTPDIDFYVEMCHINFITPLVQDDHNLKSIFIPKGTKIGTVGGVGDCPSCDQPHIHMAAFYARVGAPWDNTGFCYSEIPGFCRMPIAYESYANFSLALSGDEYPPKEENLYEVANQYRDDAVGISGGGSDEGDPTVTPIPEPTPTPVPQYGDSHVDIREDPNYGGTQYGWDNPTNGWFNVPDYMDNRTSSVAIDGGFSVKVAKDQNGGGSTKCLVVSYPDLSGAYYDDSSPMTDTISSVWVYADSTCGGTYIGTEPGDTVTVWVDPTYWNTHYGWHDPFSGNTETYVTNSITSIGVSSGWSAVLYENQNLGGGFACFTSSDPDLTNNNTNIGTPVNDNIESIEVFNDSNCGGRMHSPTATLTSTVTDVATKEVTNHLVWSDAAPGWQHFDFGDGATFDVQGGSGDVSPTHTYTNYGTYLVTVTVYGTDGIGYPYTQSVVVQPPAPNYSLTVDSADTDSGLVAFTLNWSNAMADWHHIDFGDGQSFDVNGASGSQQATHIYDPSANPYTLTFTVRGLDGQNYPTTAQINMPLPTLSLTINSVDAASGLVNYTATWANAPIDSWQRVNFGHDGVYVDYQGSADSRTDSHTFPVGTFTMTFTVNCRNGQVYQTTQQITITGQPPTYSLTIDSVDQQTGLVTFTLVWNNALADWHHIDFGDGQSFDVNGASGNQQNTHTYASGTYTMTFTVKGQDGQNYPTSQQVTVGS